ncbi:MAG: family 43 glycosylhydrolase [Betaproteobacteria bacterium]|nr:family 43 glycosylhydrolase [Betaproteobacteria bacterium]
MNPVLDRDFPDPAVLRTPGGWFYAYATQGQADGRVLNIQVARSADLVRWEHLGEALPAKPRWAARKQNFWAPHVTYDAASGRYLMYYSAEPDQATGMCLAVATARAPSGPFVDSGAPLRCGESMEHIDPMAFDDPRTGRRFLYWGAGPIRAQELAADRMGFLSGSAPVDLIVPEQSRPYRTLVEGAWITVRDGFYYLFFSGDRCCARAPRYAVMVARSRDALGPFEQLDRPILERSSFWIAPGHNSVVADDDGNDWMLYHALRAGRESRARVMLLERIVYRDGWPRVEGGEPSAAPQRAPIAGR